MRIVAGRLRRRKIASLGGHNTRPITDRAKEILFENLGGELKGERVADVFSGTGTIGLEALSRGASRVVFLEYDRQAFQLLRDNVQALEVEDETLCWKVDVTRSSFRPKNSEGFLPFDLVFFDPPYKLVAGIKPGAPLFKSLERLSRPDITSDDALLVFRVPKKTPYTVPDAWTLAWDLKISSMEIHVYRKEPAPQSSDPAPESATDAE